MSRPHRHARNGTALITALVILVGLVLLGLPFLFSQSASRAGAASFAAAQATRAYLVSAQNLGLALAIYTQEHHWKPGGTEGWTAQGETLKDFASGTLSPAPELLERKTPTGTNRVAIDLRNLPGGAWNQLGNTTRIGLELSDESGRLDMNSLGFTGWQALLQRVGLGVETPHGVSGPTVEWADWDDNEVYDNQIGQPLYSDGNSFGQLVDSIMDWRVNHRFTQVDDLLQIDPRSRPTPPSPPGTTIPIEYWRPGLTRAEVEKLRPFLTVYAQGQGRLGLQDVGNVVTTDIMDPDRPWVYADPGTTGLLPSEGFLRSQGKGTHGEAIEGLLLSGTVTSNRRVLNCVTGPGEKIAVSYDSNASDGTPFTVAGDNAALMTTVPPAINGHALTPEVGYVLDVLRTPSGNAIQLTNPLTAPQAPVPTTGVPATSSPWGPIIKSHERSKNVNISGFDRDLRSFSANFLAFGGAETRSAIPLEWASYGLTRMTVAAQVTDLLGHPTAHQQRTVVVQALPQEDFLERRWLSQGALQSLVDQRFTSQAMTLPNPVDRAADQIVDDPVYDPVHSLGPKTTTGITAKPLANFNVGQFPAVDWQGVVNPGQAAKPASVIDVLRGIQDVAALEKVDFTDWTDPANADALHNDGLYLGDGKSIAWQLIGNSPLGVATGELPARHLRGWVCPTKDWGNMNVPSSPTDPVILLEARSANLIAPQGATAGIFLTPSSDLQNLIQLAWDPKKNLLILSQASPAAEHPVDTTTLFMDPEAPLTSLRYPLQDPRSLATGTLPLAPKAGDDTALQAISPLLRTSRISLIYRMPNGFPIGQWRHIQVILGGGQPGGLGLLVDGIAGRDLTLTGDAVTTPSLGDHALVPSLVLDKQDAAGNGLPLVNVLATTTDAERKKLMPDKIVCKLGPLASVLAIKANHYFASRGVIRIGDEYISYDDMTQSNQTVTFTRCRRGVRQDTTTGVTVTPQEAQWPGTQAHAPDSLVIPGSFRAFLGNGTLYAGKTVLMDSLQSGDPNSTAGHQFEIWGKFSVAGVLGDGAVLTELTAPVPPVPQVPWPDYGIIKLSGTIASVAPPGAAFTDFYEFERTGSTFKLATIDGSAWTWRGTKIIGSATPRTTDGTPLVGILCSVRVQDNPTGVGLFSSSGNGMFQVMDTLGRIEWLTYTGMAVSPISATNRFYFTFSDGLKGNFRGEERTVFDAVTLPEFHSGSLVLPVQKEFLEIGKLLVPGDVITLIPSPGITGVARQLIVRYASNDGYGNPVGSVALADYDKDNRKFSFSDGVDSTGLPLTVTGAQDWQVICGVGWCGGVNLTRGGNAKMEASALPRLDRMGVAGGAPGRLAIGSGDVVRGAPANSQKPMIIDGWTAGPWGSPNFAQALAFFKGNAYLPELVSTDTTLDKIYVLLNEDVIAMQMGLLDLNGEVFAYRKLSGSDVQDLSQVAQTWSTNPFFNSRKVGLTLASFPGNPALADWSHYIVQLIGRGLLNSQRRTHRVEVTDGPESSVASQASWPRLHVVRLPVGPVGLMSDPTTFQSGNWTPLEADMVNGFRGIAAPAILVTEPIPSAPVFAKVECLALAGPNQRPIKTNPITHVVIIPNDDLGKSITVPWLRGLYNTPKQTWADTGDLHPILIGWWPRYASALPSTSSATTLTKQHFRSRSYAWLGFPLRLVRSRFDNGAAFTVNMDTTLPANDGLASLFTLSARAMVGTVNGSTTLTGALEDQGYNNWLKRTPDDIPFAGKKLTDLFKDFDKVEVDGMEVRVTWHYQNGPDDSLERIAEAMNRAPVIKGVTMTCHAPACVVGVEER